MLIISYLIIFLILVNPLSYYLCYFIITLLKTVLLQSYTLYSHYVCYVHNCCISNCEYRYITFLIFHS